MDIYNSPPYLTREFLQGTKYTCSLSMHTALGPEPHPPAPPQAGYQNPRTIKSLIQSGVPQSADVEPVDIQGPLH